MKKNLVLLLIMLQFYSFDTLAQKYYVYDGDDFNVMIKANTDNTQILEISFTDAAKTKWIKFEISDFYNYESTEQGGFTYLVVDGKGDKYYLDYFRDRDYVLVSDYNNTNSWRLYRRKE